MYNFFKLKILVHFFKREFQGHNGKFSCPLEIPCPGRGISRMHMGLVKLKTIFVLASFKDKICIYLQSILIFKNFTLKIYAKNRSLREAH